MKRLIATLLFFVSTLAQAALTDIKFGRYQIADSQWNVSACLYTTTCQIYSKNPGTAYKIPWTSGQVSWAAGDYVQFELSNDPNFPYVAKQYTSTGTLKSTLGTGKIVNMGPDYFFFVGNDNNTGQLFSGSSGMSNTSGVTWTGTLNPTVAQANAYADANYSTVPLSQGQTATTTPSSSPPPPPPPSYGVNFTRITSFEWKSYTAGSQPVSAEQAHQAFDNNNGSKWLGLRSQGAWVVVQLVTDGTYSPTRAVQKIQFVTANDDAGRDPTGYRIWGSINGIDWILIKQESISLPDGRFATSVVYELNNVTAYAYYKVEFTGVKSGGDMFQIAEIRLIYDVDDPQGTKAGGGVYVPPPLCCGGSASAFNANTGFVTRLQTFTNRTTADSQVYIEQIGNSNIITVQQTGTRNNYVNYFSNGSFNTANITQSGNSSTSANYIEANVGTATSASNSNVINLTQQSTGGAKGMLINVRDSNNALTIRQTDSGSHYAEVTLSGSNKNVDILQQGSANHMTNINLGGAATNLNLTQSGNTQQHYSITHTCATAGGCGTITVNQGQ